MSPSIACPQCGGTNFQKKEGHFYCSQCKLRSEEHGQETEVDDESFGAFTSGVASTLRRRRIGAGARTKSTREPWDKRPFPTSFTHIDMFTFVLKAWVDEAMQLGASDDLKDVALCLW